MKNNTQLKFNHNDQVKGLVVMVDDIRFDKEKGEGMEYRFYRVKPVVDGQELSTRLGIKGTMQKLIKGQLYKVDGTFKQGDKYLNLQVDHVYLNNTLDYVSFEKIFRKILKTNGIKAIRAKTLQIIYEAHGEDCFKILMRAKDSDTVTAWTYFREDLASKIQDVVKKNIGAVEISGYLAAFGFDSRQISNIIEYYDYDKSAVEKVLERNPYLLLKKRIAHVGFKTVDRLAMRKGFPEDSRDRLGFGMEYAIELASSSQGHCYLTKKQLIKSMLEELGLRDRYMESYIKQNSLEMDASTLAQLVSSREDWRDSFGEFFKPYNAQLNEILREKVSKGDIVEATVCRYTKKGEKHTKGYYLPEVYKRERFIANKLADMLTVQTDVDIQQARKRLAEITEEDAKKDPNFKGLTSEQEDAVIKALANRLSVITGSAGTGKTTVVRYVLKMYREMWDVESMGALSLEGFINTAPTGKAANRAKEVTGIDGMTIHRLLEYRGDKFEKNQDNPLEQKVVIVDECSMADLDLFYFFLRAIQSDTYVVLVGDHYQLPSVGAGFVFGDVIESNFPVTRLTKVWRQKDGSSLLNFCDDIRQGKPIVPKNIFSEDFEWTGNEGVLGCTFDDLRKNGLSPEVFLKELSVERIPKVYGIDEVQALSAKYAGEYGVDRLNNFMQESINPQVGGRDDNEVRVKISKTDTQVLREGDRVIHIQNNAELAVFNGEVGTIRKIVNDSMSPISDMVFNVDFSGSANANKLYPYRFLAQLRLAYALSIHKSQGSEYMSVVLFLGKGDKYMIDRSVLYTAATRARDFLFIVYDGEHTDSKGKEQPNMIEYCSKSVKAEYRNTNLRYLINLKLEGK